MKKHYAELAQALDESQLVKIYRKSIDDNSTNGYVVGLSNKWVLIHLIDGNFLAPSGYVAVRLADISRYIVDKSFVSEYLRLKSIHPVKLPQIDLSDLPSLLISVSKIFPLFMIECERIEPGVGFIGQIEKITKRNIHLKELDTKAKWKDTKKYKLKDITCLDFGDGYIEALGWMNRHLQEMDDLSWS